MKCRYRFPVTHGPRLRAAFPIRIGSTEYSLQLNDAGVVTAIDAVVTVEDKALWPKIIPDPVPGIKARISLHQPELGRIQEELRVIEGLLAIYGLSSIEIESPDENWEAESEEERAQLELFSFGPSRKPPPDETRPMITFDLVARSFLAARRARATEVALSFFRKGRNDFLEKRHIEAVYDFYFMLELLFGCGKTKNYQVKAEFKKASQLRNALEEILSAPQPLADFRPDPRTLAEFERCYRGKTVDEVIDDIVDLRGFLHHHTSERPGIWHPEGHAPYECHAMFLVRVAHNIAFDLSQRYIFSAEAVAEYQQMYKGVRELRKEKRTSEN